MNFENLAPFLANPLILMGFFFFLFMGVIKLLLSTGKFSFKFNKKLVNKIVDYGFILTVLVVVLGFVLTLRGQSSLSTETQKNNVVINQPDDEIIFPESDFYTGWLFLGYYDEDNQNYIGGQYGKVAHRTNERDKDTKTPILGDIVHITKERNIVIADYDLTGTEKELESPDLLVLEDKDYTGAKIPKNSLVLVHDTGRPLSERPGQEFQAVWVRYGLCTEEIEACRIARTKSR